MDRLQVLVTLKRWNRFLNLSLPVPVLAGAGVALALVLLVSGGLCGRLLFDRWAAGSQVGSLARENQQLKQQVAAYAAAMDTFRQFLAQTEQMDNKLRASVNLYIIPSDIRLLGIGGSEPASPEPQVDAMLRRVRFERQSLTEIATAAREQEVSLTSMPSIWPVQGWVNSGFGYRHDPFTGAQVMHPGLDIIAPEGTPIVATASGRVTFAGWKSGWGRCVEIDHGRGITTFYGHCRSLKATVGESVDRGTVIATVGSSGRSTGTHLHYGVMANGRWVDPENYIITQLSAN